jgi:hypothetical protein
MHRPGGVSGTGKLVEVHRKIIFENIYKTVTINRIIFDLQYAMIKLSIQYYISFNYRI